MMALEELFVVPRGDQWAVIHRGQAYAFKPTKEHALEVAWECARNLRAVGNRAHVYLSEGVGPLRKVSDLLSPEPQAAA